MTFRPQKEISQLLKLAVPVMIGQLAWMGMSATDVVIAGRYATEELAGVAIGSNIWVLIAFFFFGFSMAAHPLIGHHFGAGRFVKIRFEIQQCAWMAVLTGVLCTGFTLLAAHLLPTLGYEEVLAQIASGYLGVVAWGGLAITLMPVFRSSLDAMNQTKTTMVIMLTAFVLNIPLDYMLVYGVWIFPELGGVGCAWATAIILWAMVLSMALALYLPKYNRRLRIFYRISHPDLSHILGIVKLGGPIGGAYLIEAGFFVLAALLVAYFGQVAAASHSVTITIASAFFMLYMGLGQGITIRASQFLGSKSPELAWKSIQIGILFTLAFAVVNSSVLLLTRHWLPTIFTNDSDVIELASWLLLWAALFQFFDAAQVVGSHALRAYKITLAPAVYQLIAFWILAFPLGYSLGEIGWYPPFVGPTGYWVAMNAGLIISTGLILAKLWRVGNDSVEKNL